MASGEADLAAPGMNSVTGLMDAGRMRPLAVAWARRPASHPDIATLRERIAVDSALYAPLVWEGHVARR